MYVEDYLCRMSDPVGLSDTDVGKKYLCDSPFEG